MKKFLLVTLIGLVFAMNLYGIVKELTTVDVQEVDHVKETTITVYME